jgi:hypothetical protein
LLEAGLRGFGPLVQQDIMAAVLAMTGTEPESDGLVDGKDGQAVSLISNAWHLGKMPGCQNF